MQRIVKILLVEDDQLDQLEVKRTLDKKNIMYKLKIARNGEEGLQMLTEPNEDVFAGKPDLILLDLNMPKLNGFEFLEKLRSMNEFDDVKIFILTTSDDKEDKTAGWRNGVSGYITKPLKLESPSSIDAFNLMIDLMNFRI